MLEGSKESRGLMFQSRKRADVAGAQRAKEGKEIRGRMLVSVHAGLCQHIGLYSLPCQKSSTGFKIWELMGTVRSCGLSYFPDMVLPNTTCYFNAR